MSIRSLLICCVLLLWVLSGCAKKAPADYPYDAYDAEESESYGFMVADSAPKAKRAMAAPRRQERSAMPAAPPPRSQAAGGFGDEAEEPLPVPAASTRMVHYSGYARVRVQSVEAATDAAISAVEAVGGAVESVSGRVVTLRVPKAVFQDQFDALLALGDVVDKSITARDITDAFTAVDLRLKTAKRTRDRLVELLARAEDEKEKLELVRQIQRVTEEIELLEGQHRTLDALARMSRITLELVPRSAQSWRDTAGDTAELSWIRALSPFQPDLVSDGKGLPLDVPAGMVQLTPKRRFIAEGPDGTRLWSGRLPNEPQGDGAFWVAAIQERLAGEFASATVDTVGGFAVLTLVDRGDAPYTWIIAVQPRGKWLEVVEAYFPSPSERARFEAGVRASLTAAGSAS